MAKKIDRHQTHVQHMKKITASSSQITSFREPICFNGKKVHIMTEAFNPELNTFPSLSKRTIFYARYHQGLYCL